MIGAPIDSRAIDVIERCLMDFVRRGGLDEVNAREAAQRVTESLALLGFIPSAKQVQ